MGNDRSGKLVSKERALALLREGMLEEIRDSLPWSSNYTFPMVVRDGEHEAEVIYKPRKGERPLWDFPDGTLYLREVAAYAVSEGLGWGFVPPTVRRDGPHGAGMIQLRVPFAPEVNYFSLTPEFRPQLQRISLFDHVVNNADRKGGHVLLGEGDRLWSIDHGICFHVTPKVRTVIWDFADEPIPPGLLHDLEAFCAKLRVGDALHTELGELLSQREMAALERRVLGLLDTATYPKPGPGRNYPWPPV
jgi:uncharacterized repeat protein (TIGR03843 family)